MPSQGVSRRSSHGPTSAKIVTGRRSRRGATTSMSRTSSVAPVTPLGASYRINTVELAPDGMVEGVGTSGTTVKPSTGARISTAPTVTSNEQPLAITMVLSTMAAPTLPRSNWSAGAMDRQSANAREARVGTEASCPMMTSSGLERTPSAMSSSRTSSSSSTSRKRLKLPSEATTVSAGATLLSRL